MTSRSSRLNGLTLNNVTDASVIGELTQRLSRHQLERRNGDSIRTRLHDQLGAAVTTIFELNSLPLSSDNAFRILERRTAMVLKRVFMCTVLCTMEGKDWTKYRSFIPICSYARLLSN